jgi:hypothetical protein
LLDSQEEVVTRVVKDRKETAKSTVMPVYTNAFQYPFIRNIMLHDRTSSGSIFDMNPLVINRQCLQGITRVYEYDFLREANSSERGCIKDDLCRVHLIPGNTSKVVLREFYAPEQYSICLEKNIWAPERQTCILCRMYQIGLAYYNVMSEHKSVDQSWTLSDIYNVTNLPGEYQSKQCLLPGVEHFLGIWMPVLQFNVFNYTMEYDAAVGVHRLLCILPCYEATNKGFDKLNGPDFPIHPRV